MDTKIDNYLKKKVDIGLDLISNNHKLKKEKKKEENATNAENNEEIKLVIPNFENVKYDIMRKIQNMNNDDIFKKPSTNIEKTLQILFFYELYPHLINNIHDYYLVNIEKTDISNEIQVDISTNTYEKIKI